MESCNFFVDMGDVSENSNNTLKTDQRRSQNELITSSDMNRFNDGVTEGSPGLDVCPVIMKQQACSFYINFSDSSSSASKMPNSCNSGGDCENKDEFFAKSVSNNEIPTAALPDLTIDDVGDRENKDQFDAKSDESSNKEIVTAALPDLTYDDVGDRENKDEFDAKSDESSNKEIVTAALPDLTYDDVGDRENKDQFDAKSDESSNKEIVTAALPDLTYDDIGDRENKDEFDAKSDESSNKEIVTAALPDLTYDDVGDRENKDEFDAKSDESSNKEIVTAALPDLTYDDVGDRENKDQFDAKSDESSNKEIVTAALPDLTYDDVGDRENKDEFDAKSDESSNKEMATTESPDLKVNAFVEKKKSCSFYIEFINSSNIANGGDEPSNIRGKELLESARTKISLLKLRNTCYESPSDIDKRNWSRLRKNSAYEPLLSPITEESESDESGAECMVSPLCLYSDSDSDTTLQNESSDESENEEAADFEGTAISKTDDKLLEENANDLLLEKGSYRMRGSGSTYQGTLSPIIEEHESDESYAGDMLSPLSLDSGSDTTVKNESSDESEKEEAVDFEASAMSKSDHKITPKDANDLLLEDRSERKRGSGSTCAGTFSPIIEEHESDESDDEDMWSSCSSDSDSDGTEKTIASDDSEKGEEVNYKALWKAAIEENNALKKQLNEENGVNLDDQEPDVQFANTKTNDTVDADDLSEKMALESKLFRVEQDMQLMQFIKLENKRLEEHNEMLTRIVGKLSRVKYG